MHSGVCQEPDPNDEKAEKDRKRRKDRTDEVMGEPDRERPASVP